MAEDYESMTVAQPKEPLKEAGLPVSGKKSDLIARLHEAAGETEEMVEDDAPVEDVEEEDSWDDEDWDDEDEDVYMVKQKPVLDDDMKAALALRAAQKKKTPPSAEPNGSGTSDFPARDGAPPTGWTTNSAGITSTVAPWCESVWKGGCCPFPPPVWIP